MTSGLSGVLPSRDLKSLKSDDGGLCDGRVNQDVGLGGILPSKKKCPLRYVGHAIPWNGVLTESSEENTALIALDSNHGAV